MLWTMYKKRSMRYSENLLEPALSLALFDCARIKHFSKWIYVCMYHSFMLKRVKQYLARNSNGRYALHTKHRVHCLLLWLFACVLSMFSDAISCLVCCQNALITRDSKYTNIFFGRSLVFFSSSIFSLPDEKIVCVSMRMSFTCKCNRYRTVYGMKNCTILYLNKQKSVYEYEYGSERKNWVRARQIVWLVQCSSLCHAIDIPTNTGPCVVDRIFKYFSFARSLFCYNIHSVFIFRGADKRI